jgi:iron(II)-dependent oxidoreductase
MPTGARQPEPNASVADAIDRLDAARGRTLDLLDSVSSELQQRQFSPILSPMVWDLAHIGNYEDIWLVRALTGDRVTPAGLDQLYDAFEQPRAGRAALPLLGPHEARTYIADVRARVLDALASSTVDRRLADGDDPLLRDAYVLGLVLQHEHQHDETLLQARQLMGEGSVAVPLPPRRAVERQPARRADADAWIRFPGGSTIVGTNDVVWAYDNERPAHVVELAPFQLARTPVTCEAWLAFMADGGYARADLWHPDGWAWRVDEQVSSPMAWRDTGGSAWSVLRFGTWRDVDPLEPVQHVSWWEADAFARWTGARLPTEHEWETAAQSTSIGPSGRDNLGQRSDGPMPFGALAGDDADGPIRLFGDVWEWTSSEFCGYPDFHPFPYREYSEAHFDLGMRVLRGGSWATAPDAVRPTFRNWDLPIRRQLFCGLRLARDIEHHETRSGART